MIHWLERFILSFITVCFLLALSYIRVDVVWNRTNVWKLKSNRINITKHYPSVHHEPLYEITVRRKQIKIRWILLYVIFLTHKRNAFPIRWCLLRICYAVFMNHELNDITSSYWYYTSPTELWTVVVAFSLISLNEMKNGICSTKYPKLWQINSNNNNKKSNVCIEIL